MKENVKWMPHIIAAAAFVIFVGLGLASASSPSADGSPETGGSIYVKNTSNYDTYWAVVEQIVPLTYRETRPNSESGPNFVNNDGEYIIRYIVAQHDTKGDIIRAGESNSPYPALSYWHSKTVHVSGGKRVTVNIP